MKQIDIAVKELLFRSPLVRHLIYNYQMGRLKVLLPHVLPALERYCCRSVLDLGPNTCVLAEQLASRGFDVVGLDVLNWSVSSVIQPILYDGKEFPFGDSTFDCGLAISMLHHTSDPLHLLSELRRTCRFLLIQEDLVTSTLRYHWTKLLDSTANLEILQHPHSNKSDSEWRVIFKKLDLECLEHHYYKWQMVQFGVYLLKA